MGWQQWFRNGLGQPRPRQAGEPSPRLAVVELSRIRLEATASGLGRV